MGILDDFSAKLWPHTAAVTQSLEHHRAALERFSDIEKPDVQDVFRHVIRKGKFPAEAVRLSQDVREQEPAGPTLGEIWLFQSICVYGIPGKSPRFAIRTNTGRLIASVIAEGMGMETPGGDVAILLGEELIFEPSAEGTYDFTLTFRRIFEPRPAPNAGYGRSNERYDRPSHSDESEPDRGLPNLLPNSQFKGPGVPVYDEEYGGDISPDPIIAGEPVGTESET